MNSKQRTPSPPGPADSATTRAPLPARPWARAWQSVQEQLAANVETGLSAREVRQRARRYGPNALPEAKGRSPWTILLDQFKSVVVILLIVAGLISLAFGDLPETIAIGVVVLVNAAIGFATEMRATRSMEALRKLGTTMTSVRRESERQEVPSAELVPGDVVILEAGDVVAADIRLIASSRLQADESALTGESVPVGKDTEPTDEEASLAERSNMTFKGTAITRGAGEGLVVATGPRTELGQVAALAEATEEERTPLEKRLDQLGQKLVWVTLGIAGLVGLSGIVRGKETVLMIETAIALAVAAIPEGLPIVATIALARGMWRMAQRNALINRLSAVETLGATTIVCTDKTGTLTENQMTVRALALPSGVVKISGGPRDETGELTLDGQKASVDEVPGLREALETAVLCTEASVAPSESGDGLGGMGDPMEVALLVAGWKAGIQRDDLLERLPEVHEEAFDPEVKMMATVHQDGDGYRVAVKGAPEAVLGVCSSIAADGSSAAMGDDHRQHWLQENARMAEQGRRVLALATKRVGSAEAPAYEGLTFLGLVGLADPARAEVKEAIRAAHGAGIRVVMVTGDQAPTAQAIAQELGLSRDERSEVVMGNDVKSDDEASEEARERSLHADIFARVSPRQKLDLVGLHQANNAVVAMTGDGVNDAPALKKADIGVAMGQRGTEVAREASDMVLLDDSFSTIVHAVEQGRVIFRNIRRFVLYLLSCNVSEVAVVGLASLANAPLPILPLQILFLNLVTDVFPALALGAGEGEAAIMQQPPRDPREPILTGNHWRQIAGYGAAISAVVLLALGLALDQLGMSKREAVTASFLTLAFAQLWHVFNMRDPDTGLFNNDVVRNRFVWGALVLCTGMLLGAVYIPPIADVMKVERLSFGQWGMVIGLSLVPLAGGQAWKLFLARRIRRARDKAQTTNPQQEG